MQRRDDEITWEVDGKPVRIGLTRAGSGPLLLLLPALSSISTRSEMWPLQERLADTYATLAIDWPGFGTLPRPKVDWKPEHYVAFLKFVLGTFGSPETTLAAGHAAGYALAQAAGAPGSLGRLWLLSPTWRGPLPTMMSRRSAALGAVARAVDLPVAGAAFYRLNINGPVIGMMARGHVYADPEWLGPERMAEKRRVTEAEGARYSSFRFVSGALDLFADREGFLETARAAGELRLLYGVGAPRKSRAEMLALAELPNVHAEELPRGKLSFYEEFPDDTLAALRVPA